MKLDATIAYLCTKKRVLFLTTSNRWQGDKEIPKSTRIALALKRKLGQKVTHIDIPVLNIAPCEGNVSRGAGNNCGPLAARLLDKQKNPTGHHRCWASINNKQDELWKVSKALFQSDCVVFFGSVRWGQMNSFYQKLIERLTWLENRRHTLGEKNLLKNIGAGVIVTGQNWNGKEVVKTQKKVLSYFGFQVVNELCWNWQFTKDARDESMNSYKLAAKKFEKEVLER